jgi:hypothetical protein
MNWTEARIIKAIGEDVLARKCLLLVDNCNWTGHECDLLAIRTDLRIIDIEIKISRADFRNDKKKSKWWHSKGWGKNRVITHRDWPPKVWKHYFAIPAEIWSDELIEDLPSEKCGIILLHESRWGTTARIHKRAVPSRSAEQISATDAIEIARLANLRMWNAYHKLENLRLNPPLQPPPEPCPPTTSLKP